MTAVAYENFTAGRAHFRDLLDAALRGHSAVVRRDAERVAFVDADRFRHALTALTPAPEVYSDPDGFTVVIPGIGLATDGATLSDAIDDMVEVMRYYAQDWHDHLSEVPNHAENWGFAQLVTLSDDEQLHSWLGAVAPVISDVAFTADAATTGKAE